MPVVAARAQTGDGQTPQGEPKPRYFFHTAEGDREVDEVGVELADARAARTEAIRLAGALLTQEPNLLTSGGDFRVEVTDNRGRLISTIITLSVDVPSAS